MSSDFENYRIDKRQVRAAFERAAPNYDAVAVLQREVGNRVLERLQLIRTTPERILDIGAGTGLYTSALSKMYSKAHVVAVDIAEGMLKQTRQRMSLLQKLMRRQSLVCADAEMLPLVDRCADMVFSNLTLQWCIDLDRTFRDFLRVLKPGGLLMFSTFGPDTLRELRQSWRAVDDAIHVNAFIDMHDIGDALSRTGFADLVMDVEYITLTYPDIYTLMRDIKTLGAHNVTSGRRHGLTGKGRITQLAQAYENFRTKDGVLPLTYEVVYGHAWVPDLTTKQRAQDGVTKVPLEHLRRRPPSSTL